MEQPKGSSCRNIHPGNEHAERSADGQCTQCHRQRETSGLTQERPSPPCPKHGKGAGSSGGKLGKELEQRQQSNNAKDRSSSAQKQGLLVSVEGSGQSPTHCLSHGW